LTTLELDAIDKSFGALRAVRAAALKIAAGQIHAVVGENGAGKSTLLRVAAGILVPDAGRTLIDGAPLAPHTAAEAIARGVAMVEQHFALIGVFTALENLMLGLEPTVGPFGALDGARARAAAERAMHELGVDLPLDERVENLGVGDRQRLEIVRALVREARIVILDEPTAVLTPGEAEALYGTLRHLADGGRAVVVVTHKLDEVQAHADRVTVMRHGRTVMTDVVRRDASREEELAALAHAIMGGDPPPLVTRERSSPGKVRLAVSGLAFGRSLVGVSFEVRAGEIVGIAGVEGNGQRELVRVLAGLEEADAGSVRGGEAGIAVVHEDRQVEGLVLDASVLDNLLLGGLEAFDRRGILDLQAMVREAGERSRRFGITPPDPLLLARELSGGNQQKIVMARAIARMGTGAGWSLVAAHPTRDACDPSVHPGGRARGRRRAHSQCRPRRAAHPL
jgi:ABC-type uncharacterized transport system ATPase subunit